MGATADLVDEQKVISSGMDSVVIRNFVAGIIGGRTLDMTGFTGKVIKSGHIVIRDTESDTYKPMPVSNNAYSALPANHEYEGVVVCSKPADKPFVGIMYSGEVNDKASPYPIDGIKAALKQALPTLVFKHD